MLLTLSLRSHVENAEAREHPAYYQEFRELVEALWTESNTLRLGECCKVTATPRGQPPNGENEDEWKLGGTHLISYTLMHAEADQLAQRVNDLTCKLETFARRKAGHPRYQTNSRTS